MRKTNLLMGFVCAIIGVMVCSSVSATAPVITDLSPDNNSVVFGNATLSATATDAEEDPINYTFYVEPGIYMNNSGWTGGTEGDSFGNPNAITASPNNWDTSLMYRDITINQDFLYIYYSQYTTQVIHCLQKIKIDGDTLYSADPPGNSVWYSQYLQLDLINYNDNQDHTLEFSVSADHHTPCNIKFWFPQYTNETPTSEEIGFNMSNSSNNSFTLNYNFSDSGGGGYHYLDPKRWWVTAYDNNSESTTSDPYNINFMDFNNCTSGDIVLNFTIQDEETEDLLTSSFEAEFTLDDTKTFNFDLEGEGDYQFCLNPGGIDVTLDGFVSYLPDNENYSYNRNYYFNDATINGDTQQDIELYALEDDLATQITFNVNLDGASKAGAYIYAERYNIGEGTSTLVSMAQTDIQGQTTMYLRYGDAFYTFKVYDDGELLGTDGPSLLSTTTKTFNFWSASEQDHYWPVWTGLTTIDYNFSWINATNVSRLYFSDPSGLSTEGCLRTREIDYSGESQVCYSCESTASATIDCLLTDLDANYINEFIVNVNGSYYVMASSYLSLEENLSDLIGLDGVFLSIFIIGLLAFVGLFNPAASVLFSMLGVIVCSMFGLINIGLAALVAILFVGGVIAFKLKS